MIPRIELQHCKRLIDDISAIDENYVEDVMPYILRSAIILFSAEVEDNIKKIITDINNSISESDQQFYSDFITKRNKIAHDPRASISFSFKDFIDVVKIGETILNSINKSLFLKVTEHIKNEFT